jgi:hypothetical protein
MGKGSQCENYPDQRTYIQPAQVELFHSTFLDIVDIGVFIAQAATTTANSGAAAESHGSTTASSSTVARSNG